MRNDLLQMPQYKQDQLVGPRPCLVEEGEINHRPLREPLTRSIDWCTFLMKFLFPCFSIFSFLTFLMPNTYSNQQAAFEHVEFQLDFSWPQCVCIGLMYVIGVIRCGMTVNKEDTIERRYNARRHMTFTIVFGLINSIAELAMLFYYPPASQVR